MYNHYYGQWKGNALLQSWNKYHNLWPHPSADPCKWHDVARWIIDGNIFFVTSSKVWVYVWYQVAATSICTWQLFILERCYIFSATTGEGNCDSCKEVYPPTLLESGTEDRMHRFKQQLKTAFLLFLYFSMFSLYTFIMLKADYFFSLFNNLFTDIMRYPGTKITQHS